MLYHELVGLPVAHAISLVGWLACTHETTTPLSFSRLLVLLVAESQLLQFGRYCCTAHVSHFTHNLKDPELNETGLLWLQS